MRDRAFRHLNTIVDTPCTLSPSRPLFTVAYVINLFTLKATHKVTCEQGQTSQTDAYALMSTWSTWSAFCNLFPRSALLRSSDGCG